MIISKQFHVYYDRQGLYRSGCHKHSNRCNSLQLDSSGHTGSQQHGEKSLGDRSDTGLAWGRCNAYTSCHMAHRFPITVQFKKSLYRVNKRKTLSQSAMWEQRCAFY